MNFFDILIALITCLSVGSVVGVARSEVVRGRMAAKSLIEATAPRTGDFILVEE